MITMKAAIAQFLLLLSRMIIQSSSDCPANPVAGDFYSCATTSSTTGDGRTIVDCSYTKGNIFNMTISPLLSETPGAPSYLTVLPEPVAQTAALNITWQLRADGSLRFLTGFLLNVTFQHDGATYSILRSFNLTLYDVNSFLPSQIRQVLFKYDCITTFENTEYNVQVLSYPSQDQITSKRITTGGNVNFQKTYNNSFEWVAVMWATTLPTSPTITACFIAAPAEFAFDHYVLDLQTKNDSLNPLSPITDHINITVNSQVVADNVICQQFRNVKPDDYRILLQPLNYKHCICRTGPSELDCVDSCTATELKYISVTELQLPPSSLLPPQFTSTPTSMTTTTEGTTNTIVKAPIYMGGDEGKIIGIVVGVLLAVLIMSAIFVWAYARKICASKEKKNNTDNLKTHFLPKTKDEATVPNPPEIVKQKLLLVYFNNSDDQRNVIDNFIGYLNARYNFDVIRWSVPTEMSKSELEQVDKQLTIVQNVAIVHNDESYERYKCFVRHKQEQEDAPANTLQQFKQSPDEQNQYHVFFLCAEGEHVSVDVEMFYQQKQQLLELVLDVYKSASYNPPEQTRADRDAESNYKNCSIGRQLLTRQPSSVVSENNFMGLRYIADDTNNNTESIDSGIVSIRSIMSDNKIFIIPEFPDDSCDKYRELVFIPPPSPGGSTTSLTSGDWDEICAQYNRDTDSMRSRSSSFRSSCMA